MGRIGKGGLGDRVEPLDGLRVEVQRRVVQAAELLGRGPDREEAERDLRSREPRRDTEQHEGEPTNGPGQRASTADATRCIYRGGLTRAARWVSNHASRTRTLGREMHAARFLSFSGAGSDRPA